jgi:uncharacterized protein (DUF4415 family)
MKKEYDISKLKRAQPKYLKHLKEAVTIRLDPNVISYFKELAKKTGVPYQSLINFILRDYAMKKLEPSTNLDKMVTKKKTG